MQPALSLFRALADPTRLRILALVRGLELSVGELAEVLQQSQPRVSRHLRILDDARLIERRREGAWVFVRRGPEERVAPALAALDGWAALAPPDPQAEEDGRRLAAVRAGRASRVEAYFAAHADRWDTIRLLHAADGAVDAAMVSVLGRRPLGRLLDIGTGTGHVLHLLGGSASSAVGIDLSAEMLRIARARLDLAGLYNCEVRQADMRHLPQPNATVDTIVLHQVLHFAAEPQVALAECARVLAPNGRLLVVDYAPHGREELREECAHMRLGFEDEEVLGWMRQLGLRASVVDRLPGTDLAVTMWLASGESGAGLADRAVAA